MAGGASASSSLSPVPTPHVSLPKSSSQQISQWSMSKELPFEIEQYVRIYFEESLFTRALDLLLSVVSSDVSSRRNKITVPGPEHLALASTLIVHPLITTRTSSEEKWAEANAALRLLRLLLGTVGPYHSNFRDAFKFRKLYSEENDDNLEGVIKHPFANDDSIWHRADDFWAVAGWAFNCSCLNDMYTARWKHWQLWLEFMVDVLESDWEYHLSSESPDQSIIWQYMSHTPGDTSKPRRTIRAIFADGSKSSINEFREVFKRELKGPKKESIKTEKREAVDIDEEKYGDYLQQDDSDESSENEMRTTTRSSTRTISARRATPRASKQSLHSDQEDDSTTPTSAQGLGPPSSVTLRLRLMQLLIYISYQPTLISSRTTNFPDPSDLFTLFVEFIKPLPLEVFHQLITPPTPLNPDAHITLLEYILQRLLETTSSSLTTLEPLTQDKLVTNYLPYTANKTIIDSNARVSLCIEILLRILANAGILTKAQALDGAVEQGIQKRLAKVKERKDKIKDEKEELAYQYLTESSARMRSVVRRLKG